jgi:RNA polymerase sigma factor (sigma-70 family)
MTDDQQLEFRRCYEANFAAVYRYVAARERDRAEVGDVVSEVFAVAWRRRSASPAIADERLWLLGVARRVLADHWRSGSRRRRLALRLAAEPVAGAGLSDDELVERVDAAMSVLGEREREALRLVAWDDLSRIEAAEVLGCSVNALNLRIHRALRRLSKELGGTGASGREGR